MTEKYPNIFSPIKLGPIEIPTRFFFGPHGSALSAGTKPSDDLVAYSAERVRDGGCGLVVVALVQHERGRTRQPSPHPPENIPAFRTLADAIHDAGGKIFGEVFYHWGGPGQWQPLSPPAPSMGPSVRHFAFNGRNHSTHAMSRADIRQMLAALRQSAANLRQAGFDGIMLHGSHAALIEQFLSPYFNDRNDEYGGSFENRMRFMIEALEAAREGAGPGMAVGMRFNCDEQITGGYDTELAARVVRELCARKLLDYIDLDVGLEPQQFHHGMPTGFELKQYYRPYVAKVREAARDIPVLSVLGRVTDMAEAEEAIAAGVIDMAGAARQLIAEPRFVQNARVGQEALGRTCIACNWCTAAGGDGAQGCAINPASYRERLWGTHSFEKAQKPDKVVVVGGGPGGLEAARVRALRGREVTLFEERDDLGGALRLWADLPGRGHYGAAIDWWKRELQRLKVNIVLKRRVDAAAVLAERPDAVIVATGSRYSVGGRCMAHDSDIPGHDGSTVFRPEDILIGGARPAGKVYVLDAEGYHTGVGIAEILASTGAEVEFVTPGYSPVSNRLTDNWEEKRIVQRLKALNVRLRPSTWVRSITEDALSLYDVHTDEPRQVAADGVVLVTAREPVSSLVTQLDGKVSQLFAIGDALSTRMLAAATYEGQMFARLIGVPGAPTTTGEAWFRADAPQTTLMPADATR